MVKYWGKIGFLVVFHQYLLQKYKGGKSNIIFVATKSNLIHINAD
ncbi:hypothetical protein HDE68_000691 [Pedobacter cryoconitis]|uniref:Uncharacterized protein n=1 Tax=Pedobacter cryoconitis TaxID=188932 RepID=A0A7W9DXE2_9SPHI|nr:hypothetical protein [Pedobacter cryoconitis]